MYTAVHASGAFARQQPVPVAAGASWYHAALPHHAHRPRLPHKPSSALCWPVKGSRHAPGACIQHTPSSPTHHAFWQTPGSPAAAAMATQAPAALMAAPRAGRCAEAAAAPQAGRCAGAVGAAVLPAADAGTQHLAWRCSHHRGWWRQQQRHWLVCWLARLLGWATAPAAVMWRQALRRLDRWPLLPELHVLLPPAHSMHGAHGLECWRTWGPMQAVCACVHAVQECSPAPFQQHSARCHHAHPFRHLPPRCPPHCLLAHHGLRRAARACMQAWHVPCGV